jgi:hypothetical protein
LVGQPNQSSAPTDGRDSQTKPEPPPAANIGAAVDANGNFTGDTTAGSLSSVVGA